jgi:hypothetical protein
MVIRTVGARRHAENVEDLADWLRGLDGCPHVNETALGRCRHASHENDETATWFYVEADADGGVARLRCLGGGHTTDLLDSAEHWTFPGVWACISCGHSIAEVAYGIHTEDGDAQWLAMVARCVECGDITGLTDMVLPGTPLDALLPQL